MKSAKKYAEKTLVVMFTLLAITIVNSCQKDNSYSQPMSSSSSSSSPPAGEVWMQGMAFNPSSITVNAGTTVKWTNKDSYSHTVTSNTGVFDSGTIPAGGTYSHQFGVAGTYGYHCNIHAGMMGQIVVH